MTIVAKSPFHQEPGCECNRLDFNLAADREKQPNCLDTHSASDIKSPLVSRFRGFRFLSTLLLSLSIMRGFFRMTFRARPEQLLDLPLSNCVGVFNEIEKTGHCFFGCTWVYGDSPGLSSTC